MNKLAVYLNGHLSGNVFDKDSILETYSTDRSLIKVKPRLVAIPETTADIRKIVRFSAQLSEKKYSLPIAVRGSGLCKTGADLSSGIVISTEKLIHVRELDTHDRLVHVQAGITLGKLNAVLAPHGLTLPIHADPRETIGALIANAPRDAYSQRYGGIMNYVDRAEIVLANGDLIQTSHLSPAKLALKQSQKNFEGEIYSKLENLLNKTPAVNDISDFNRIGYSAIKHVHRNNGHIFDLLPTFFGSEGSLGIITEVILRLQVLPPRAHRLFAVFPNIKTARDFMEQTAKLAPLSIELFDNQIFKIAEEYGKKPDLLTRKFDDGFVVLVSFDDKTRKSRHKIKRCASLLPKSAYVVSETLKNSADFDDFATSLSNYLNSGSIEHPNLLHDFFIPSDHLEDFLKDLTPLAKTHKKHLELYGCYSTGVYSLRPEFDLKKVDERRTALKLLRDFNEIVVRHGGSLAGGLPEGRLKSLIIYPELNKNELALYKEVKKIFDKNHIFSPNIKTDYDIRDTVKHLRIEPILDIE